MALQLSTAWDFFPTESSKVGVLESCVLEQTWSEGERGVAFSLSICGEKMLGFTSYG